MTTDEKVLIAGFGAAGLHTALSLRAAGFRGSITALSEEPELPYDRPPLSKDYLKSTSSLADITLITPEKLAAQNIDVRLGLSAEALNANDRILVDSEGEEHAYDKLVIATGVRARGLRAADLTGVYTIRNRADSDMLRESIRPGSRLTIVGAGFLGLEVAATAVGMGAKVTVIEPLEEPLANRLGRAVASRLLDLHRQHGVTILTGVGVERLEGVHHSPPEPFEGSSGEPGHPVPVASVVLTNNTSIESDTVLVSIGAEPNTDWLADSGIEIDNGVVCDEENRAAPNIWAVGDIARWRHIGLDAHVRLEHRMNATEQARAVANSMLGKGKPFVPVPFFWTDHYDVRIQFAGMTFESDPELVEGSLSDDAFVLAWSEGGHVVGAVNWNAAREMMPYRQQLLSSYARVGASYAAGAA